MANYANFRKGTYSAYTIGKTTYDADGTIFFCTDKPVIIANGVEYGVSQEIIEAHLDGVKGVIFNSATNTITVSYFKEGTPDTVITIAKASASQDGLMSKEQYADLEAVKETVNALEEALGDSEELGDALAELEVVSSDKTVKVTKDDGEATDLAVNIDGTTLVKSAEGVISVAPAALTQYEGSNAIEVTGDTTTKTIALKIASANKLLSQSADGLLATLKFVDNAATSKIELQGVDNTVLASFDYAKFVVDGMLEDAQINSSDELVLTMNTAAGSKELKVNLAKYIDVYTEGNGITISGKAISAKVKEGDSYLEVTSDGIASKGIDAAISSAVAGVNAKVEALEGKVGDDSVEDTATEVVESALGELSLETVGGTGKFVKSVSQADGQVSAEAADLNDAAIALTATGFTGNTVKAAIEELKKMWEWKEA